MHMRMKLFISILLLSAFAASPLAVRAQSVDAGTPRALLYITNSASGLASLKAHVTFMDIVAPQTYAASTTGALLGKPSTEILALARNAGAQVMPLVVNQYFSQPGVHTFLESAVAQQKLLGELIAEGKLRGYVGYQYDFEHMNVADRDLYSAFVARSATALHAAGLELSIAVAPQQSANPADYGPGSWENWTGAFDYASLGASADFLSVMAYDDSNSVGPTASLPWVKQVIAYTLARVPAQKVSLGVPFYTWVWNDKTDTRDHITGYPAVANLLASNEPRTQGWSDTLGVSWVTYTKGTGKNKLTLTAWYENQRSFQEKLDLVSSDHLAGFSAWTLGLEDPNIWTSVVAMRSGGNALAYNSQ